MLEYYTLHAFTVIPNRIHILIDPLVELSLITKCVKGFSAKRANQMLRLTGASFWQEESYDHLVRHRQEFETIRRYIEQNPVRAGLVKEAGDYRWSSARREATARSPADQEVRPAL